MDQGQLETLKYRRKTLSLQDSGLVISQSFSTGNTGKIKANFPNEIDIAGGLIFDSNPSDETQMPEATAYSTLGTIAIKFWKFW